MHSLSVKCSKLFTYMETTVFDIAKYILHQRGQMSTMKLQKLCYYAQAWSLVWDDTPLFDEDFSAWRNGPVCKPLFDVTRGKFSVTEEDEPGDIAKLSSVQKRTIDEVLKSYGDKDAQWLSSLSHMEKPWQEARGNDSFDDKSDRIVTKESMGWYYGSL